MQEQLQKENEVLFEPLYVFTSDSTGSILSVGIIKALRTDTTKTAQLKRIKELFSNKYSPESIKTAEYLKDGIHITQFLIQEKQLITFKLLFETKDKKLIEFDYLMPSGTYIDEIKAVESSIGSIKLHT